MLGAIAGDILGSTFEHHGVKTTDFPLFPEGSRFTDDSVLTVATAFTLLTDGDYAANYRLFGRVYPRAGYGRQFVTWLENTNIGPYNSWGNGSAMRVSPVAWAYETEAEVLAAAEESARVTHNHPEGIKGAQAVALAVFMARRDESKPAIKQAITDLFGYDLSRTTAAIRPDYEFDASCQGSVPEALICFLEGNDWLEGVRLAISLGGDADTMACICGAVAEAYYGSVPAEVVQVVRGMLPEHLGAVVADFETSYRQR
jgi:ADP-ribosylglycohydrolase